MLCGPPNIWPQPSIKTVLGSKALKFTSRSFLLHMDTNFETVNNLLTKAFEVFVDEVKNLETNLKDGNKLQESQTSLSSNPSENQHDKFKFSNDIVTSSNDLSDNFVPLVIPFNRITYDIESFQIVFKGITNEETYLTLNTDESYNLTLSRKLILNYDF